MNKTIITLILLSVAVNLNAQIADIPDFLFRITLLNSDCIDFDGDTIVDGNIDLNNDGLIQISETEAVKGIYTESGGSIEGIDYFSNIEVLNMPNGIGHFDQGILDFSSNPYLKEIQINGFLLQTIIVSECPNLEILKVSYISFGDLTNIDLTQNLNLKYLMIYNNDLAEIDLSQNINLEYLNLGSNPLTEIDLSQNLNLEYLNLDACSLTNIDISQNVNLTELSVSWCPIDVLDISQTPSLVRLTCHTSSYSNIIINNPNLLSIVAGYNQITDLDLSQAPNLESLAVGDNNLTSLDVSNNPKLKNVSCFANQITSLDFSQNHDLVQLYCKENSLTSLKINNGNNINMLAMIAYDNPELSCIQVDDENYANNQICNVGNEDGWCIDANTIYSENCNLAIQDFNLQSFTIYPNPSKDIININSQKQIDNIQIFTINGSLIKDSTSTTINISELLSGLYFVQINAEGNSVTKKFIKF